MATKGTATLDFGAAPGGTDATVVVTGQAAILTTSAAEAWIQVPQAASADHTPDEHWVEDLEVYAGAIVAGAGFTIYGKCNTGFASGQFTIAWVWS